MFLDVGILIGNILFVLLCVFGGGAWVVFRLFRRRRSFADAQRLAQTNRTCRRTRIRHLHKRADLLAMHSEH